MSGVQSTVEVHVPIGSLVDDYSDNELVCQFPSRTTLLNDFDFVYGTVDTSGQNPIEMFAYNVFIFKALREEDGTWKHYVHRAFWYSDSQPMNID